MEEKTQSGELTVLMKKQLTATRLCLITGVLLLAAIIISVAVVLPKFDTLLVRLNDVATQLSEVDWAALEKNINDAAIAGQQSLAKAAQAIDSMDIEGLNQAIEDLQKIIAPLARMFG